MSIIENLDTLKNYIINNCIRTNGSINGNMTNPNNWENVEFYNLLFSRCAHPSPTLAQCIFHVLNDVPAEVTCINLNCDNLVKWKPNRKLYSQTCSRRCSAALPGRHEKKRQTNIVRYKLGTYNNRRKFVKTVEGRYKDGIYVNVDKIKKTKTDRYGDPNYNNTAKAHITKIIRYGSDYRDIVDKIKKTKTDRYGDPNYNNTAKAQATNINKYGSSCYPHSDIAKARRLEKHGTETLGHINMSDYTRSVLLDKLIFENLISEYGLTGLAKYLNVDGTTIVRYMTMYNIEIDNHYSSPEKIVANMLDSMGIEYELHNREVLGGKELDFYFPAYNIAIEINGIYFHSNTTKGVDNNYHFNKWKMCRDRDIFLLSYTDTDVYNNLDKIKTKIMYLLSRSPSLPVIGARKCRILGVSRKDEFKLLTEYHIQGKLLSRSDSLGAYYNNRLVAVINWSSRKSYLEITRYVCDCKASYPGLFTKMLKAMIKKTQYSGDIVSFSNNAHSNGNLYKSAGFVIDKILGPSYWYTKDFVTLENRQKYMKSKIAKKFGIDMSTKTEGQVMQELGYYRYYDSGKIKWVCDSLFIA